MLTGGAGDEVEGKEDKDKRGEEGRGLEGEGGGRGGERGKGRKISEDEEGKDSGDITMFKSVGCAVQDIATAEYVFQRAKEMRLGTTVEM